MIALCEIPVKGSTVSLDENPSITSSYSTIPSFSEIIGIVYGSHEAIKSSGLTFFPSSINNFAPYGI